MAHPLQPGVAAPGFTLLDAKGVRVSLASYRGRNVVLAFYPGDWTPVCSSELALFQETLAEIHARDAEILGLSCDTHHSHRAWAESMNLTMPLLSDFWPHGQASREYGVFRDREGISERAVFVLDRGGIVRDVWVAEDPGVAPGLNVVFDALERLVEGRAVEALHV